MYRVVIPMAKPVAEYMRKVLYRKYDPKTRITPKISIPRWWVGDAEYVKLNVYADKIVIRKIPKSSEE